MRACGSSPYTRFLVHDNLFLVVVNILYICNDYTMDELILKPRLKYLLFF